jgi:hypothetical protein
MANLRGTFRRRFPELSQSELNMKVLVYLTPVRMPSSAEGSPSDEGSPSVEGAPPDEDA